MKTKRFFTLLWCLVPLLLGGCTKSSPNHGRVAGAASDDFLFTGIVIPDSMKLYLTPYNCYDDRNGEIHYYSRMGLGIALYGDAYSFKRTSTHGQFLELAKSLGDYPILDGYGHATPVDNTVLSCAVVGVSLQALSDYNEKYPKGSELSDIVHLSYESYDYVFPDFLPKAGDEAVFYPRGFLNSPMASFAKIQYPALNRGGRFEFQEQGKPDRAMGVSLLNVEFTEAPGIPHQKFLVTLTLGDGKKFEKEIEFDVVEYKPEV